MTEVEFIKSALGIWLPKKINKATIEPAVFETKILGFRKQEAKRKA